MNFLKYIDLHCDTLTKSDDYAEKAECNYPNSVVPASLCNGKMISLNKIPNGAKWAQFFAVFIPDSKRGQKAVDYFNFYQKSFYNQMEKYDSIILPCRSFKEINAAFAKNKFAAILTVEGGAVLNGDASMVKVIADAGVKALTLVWNGENEIGSGNVSDHGLTDFGKEVVSLLEQNNILVDVSHLNDHGFDDLLKIAKKPFIASHSNSRALAHHKRNLTDEQIKEMINRNCLIGLNFCDSFLNDDEKKASITDLFNHASHMIELGGRNCLAIGSDYDGCTTPKSLDSIEKAFNLAEYFIKQGMDEATAHAIMFDNALSFFKGNLE